MKKPKVHKFKVPNLVKANGEEIKAPRRNAFQKIHEKPSHQTMSTYGSLRYTLKETAACLGMSYETLNRFLKEDPSLRDSFDAGLLKYTSSLTTRLYSRAMEDPKIAIRVLESIDQERWLRVQKVAQVPGTTDEEKKYAELLLQAARNPTKDK